VVVDHDVIARLGEGESPAVEECFGFLLAWAAKQYSGRADIEDIVQETLAEACRSAHTYRGEAKPTTWLVAIGVRVAYRRDKNKQGRPPEVSLDAGIAEPSDAFDSEDVALRRLELQDALKQLKEDERSALWLYEVEGWSDKRIGEETGRTENAVRLARHRARLKLGEWRRKLGQ
jgi:RNA polymerase sigma-70 factor, ECF subfamily